LKAPQKPDLLKGKGTFSDSFFQPTDGEGNSSLGLMNHLLDSHFLILSLIGGWASSFNHRHQKLYLFKYLKYNYIGGVK
jgi:hypothetical protein